MSNPHGTDWCAPGEGATVQEIISAAAGIVSPNGTWDVITQLRNRTQRDDSRRTNLRLTGRPLVAYDLERIAACEVR